MIKTKILKCLKAMLIIFLTLSFTISAIFFIIAGFPIILDLCTEYPITNTLMFKWIISGIVVNISGAVLTQLFDWEKFINS